MRYNYTLDSSITLIDFERRVFSSCPKTATVVFVVSNF